MTRFVRNMQSRQKNCVINIDYKNCASRWSLKSILIILMGGCGLGAINSRKNSVVPLMSIVINFRFYKKRRVSLKQFNELLKIEATQTDFSAC